MQIIKVHSCCVVHVVGDILVVKVRVIVKNVLKLLVRVDFICDTTQKYFIVTLIKEN